MGCNFTEGKKGFMGDILFEVLQITVHFNILRFPPPKYIQANLRLKMNIFLTQENIIKLLLLKRK